MRDEAIADALARQGFARLDDVFGQLEIDELRRDRPRPIGRCSRLLHFATQPLLARIARECLGDDARLRPASPLSSPPAKLSPCSETPFDARPHGTATGRSSARSRVAA